MTVSMLAAPPGAGIPFDMEQTLIEWPTLAAEDRLSVFAHLGDAEATDLFLALEPRAQGEHLLAVPPASRRLWARLLAPDDAADVIQTLPEGGRAAVLDALDVVTRAQVSGLLAYAEDAAGGLMDPRYVVLRAEMTADEAIAYLRAHERSTTTNLYYVYVLDQDTRPIGVISLRELLRAPGKARIELVMQRDVVTVAEDAHQEDVAKVIARLDFLAVPVVDGQGRMRGIVTVDDVVDVVTEEATEDIQKLGGSEALDAPYWDVGFVPMLKKRASWLTLLFVGEMLTASAMGIFADEINKAVVLALFLPLIISSGGNSGSQASTIIVRALAVGDVRIGDWFRVLRREVLAGLALGTLLATIGFFRILLWPGHEALYGAHYAAIALTVAISVVGVVLWGTLSGSMLPMLLHKAGFDPASASAPFVATLVDVTGLIIYFGAASVVLRGTLL